jgi:hypothetical protein
MVHVVDLAGDGTLEVVVDRWSGGADCCEIEQVYTPSAALSSYVLSERNFGNHGATLARLGPGTGCEFVSGDSASTATSPPARPRACRSRLAVSANGWRMIAEFVGQDTSEGYTVSIASHTAKLIRVAHQTSINADAISHSGSTVLVTLDAFENPTAECKVATIRF